jgi:hypothetical protein
LRDEQRDTSALRIENVPSDGGTDFVTRNELNDRLSAIEGDLVGVTGDGIELSDIDGSFSRLREKERRLEYLYRKGKRQIRDGFQRLMAASGQGEEEEDDGEEKEGGEDTSDAASSGHGKPSPGDDQSQGGGLRSPVRGATSTLTDGQEEGPPADDLGQEDDLCEPEEIEFGDIDVVPDATVRQYRDVQTDCNGNVECGAIVERPGQASAKRRNVGLVCAILPKVGKKRRVSTSKGGGGKGHGDSKLPAGGGGGGASDARLRTQITKDVIARVDPLSAGAGSGGGGRMDRAGASGTVRQMGVVTEMKAELSKLRALMTLKWDREEAEKALNLRMTREELFQILQQQGRAVPVITSPDISGDLGRRGRGHTSHGGRKPIGGRVSAGPGFVPARDSRFTSYNRRYLSGNDGHIYLRDLGPLTSEKTPTKGDGVAPEAAFDFQPYVRVSEQPQEFGRANEPPPQ